jgi:hypothetical protein
MSPIAMSTIALGRDVGKLGDAKDGPKEEKPIFSSWYRELTRKTLSVFGYVIAFQIFFILVPFLTNIEFLPDTSAIASLPLFSYIDISFINMFIKMIFIICSAYLINSAPELLSDILGTSNGIDDGANVKANIKSTLNEVKASLSGKMFVNAFNYAKTQALDSGVIGGMKNLTGDVKKIGAKIISRVMYRKARINGVAKDVAKQASRQFYEATKYEVDMRRARREERIAEANSAYGSQIGSKPIQKEGDANLKKLRGKKGKIQKIKDRFKPFRP